MKIAALDLGDQWTGIALSDPLCLLARPYKSIRTADINLFLQSFIAQEQVLIIVVGLPITLRGTESEQTRKVREKVEKLRTTFSSIEWILWDERLTSKQAQRIKSARSKEERLQSHAIAAALILTTYLDYRTSSAQSSSD